MSHVQCHFCSTSNPVDATVCNACGTPLNKGELVEATVERASDGVPAGTAVVALSAASGPRGQEPARFSRRLIGSLAGAGVLVAFGVLLFIPSRSPVQAPSPVDRATSTESATPAESTPAERAGPVQGESAAATSSTPPAQQPATAERESTTLSLMEGMRRAAARGESAAATQPVEPPPPRSANVRSTVATGATARSGVAGSTSGAAPPVGDNATACTDAVAALGLCASERGKAQSAARVGASPDIAQRSANDDATRGCTDAAAALGLCVQITPRGKN